MATKANIIKKQTFIKCFLDVDYSKCLSQVRFPDLEKRICMQGTCGGFLPGNWKKQNREEETEQGCDFGKVPSISLTAGGALECKLHHDVCAPLGHSRPFILLSLAKGHTSPVIVIISVHAGRHTPRYFWLFMPHHKVSSVAFKQCSDESSRQLAKEEEGQQQNQTSPNTVAWGRYIETVQTPKGVWGV